MKAKAIVVGVVVIAIALSAPVTAKAESGKDRARDFVKAPSSGQISSTVNPKYADPDAGVSVMVQLSGDPVAVVQAKAGHRLSKTERTATKAKLSKAQNAIVNDIAKVGGKVLTKLQSAYNGMRVRVPRSKTAALAALPGVSGVHPIIAKSLDSTVSVPFVGAPRVWQHAGVTGKGVKVAIIDSGIDYTHADFGGPGTVDAYARAKERATQAADPELFGAAAVRVKGGYDFVGDDYDASTDGKNIPKPDPNPLDCGGHGTHVAGITAGGGVSSNGLAFSGPYDQATTNMTFRVGPGVAPQADLYALRVFGCSGTTEATTEAIDWAVDHDMDVINISMGAPYGRASDPDAVAASNAVAAGVVVVAAAGNSGPSPYLAGSPASGHGVISVAAMDATGSFPGASLEVGGKTISAINANGAALPAGDFKVVVLTDDPATEENETLGCSVNAFAKSGTVGGSRQLAVVARGDCGRAAKAIYGQQAGAAAVLMINDADGYPPYEGAIDANPDTGEDAAVTIPFLGIKSGDAAAVNGAAGQRLTMVSASVDNPDFREVAAFSSGGPVNGDSGLGPDVTAPGVSIASAALGTGSSAQIRSGTSMAAPHVAGVAALTVQAHPSWTASQRSAALVGTADPKGVEGYTVTVAGAGLIDPAQAVSTQTFVTGDQYHTKAGKLSEDSLSFGFAEPSLIFAGTKKITITNTGKTPVTYSLKNVAASQSRPAVVKFSSNKVQVPAGRSVSVAVTLVVAATSVGSSLSGSDQAALRQVSGNVVLTSAAGELRVPYLLVPRAKANVSGRVAAVRAATALSPSASPTHPHSQVSLQLSNLLGAADAYADIYSWGLQDGADLPKGAAGSGYDLRAAGVQSFADGDDQLLVFAVNNHDRWSNAAATEFDVAIDTNRDGAAEYVVFSVDSGAMRTGDFDGVSEVFVADLSTGDTYAAGFLAQAPTDSSTILLPVYASDLGLTAAAGNFSYTVSSYTMEGSSSDEFAGWASYNPWSRAIEDGGGATVRRNGFTSVPVGLNLANFAVQKPNGLMVVVADNRSGGSEAQLLSVR